MHKIAIILFPGTNCHDESYRAVRKAGMEPEYFRWNDNYERLKEYDGYFIPGGFSYEDRVRSGAIAGRDPIMNIIREQASLGKPVIGICNGAQILVESGLIPGLSGNNLDAGLAWNNHGYLNIWVRITNDAKLGRCAFNNFEQGHHFKLPIAHGEGRWVIPQETLEQLIANGQCVFRYCDDAGQIKDEFPINPNGAVYNLAGVCNPLGNVLALMPHPERTPDGQVIFESMKRYLDQVTNNKKQDTNKFQFPIPKPSSYKKPKDSVEFLVDLIITDNEAETLQMALNDLGYKKVKVSRLTHYEIGVDKKSDKLIDDLIKSGVLLNTNKEIPYIDDWSTSKPKAHKILVRYKDDFDGQGKLNTLNKRLGLTQVNSVKKGILWQIECQEADWQKILKSNILFNPYSQEALIYRES